MNQTPIVIFVCEHGAAKSIVAAAYFDKLAKEAGFDRKALARGTNPEMELSPLAVAGLWRDGLKPKETIPQLLSTTDVKSAQRLIAFCDLPAEYNDLAIIEQWEDIPPISENYETARDVLIPRIKHLLQALESGSDGKE